MEKILSLPREEQAQIYQEAAARSNNIKSPYIMEKDFWVCWTLKQIFSIPEFSSCITFKGGTSLSKCYTFINRFSEDCDLTLDKQFLEINEDVSQVVKKSRSKKDGLKAKLNEAVSNKVINDIQPNLTSNFKSILSNYFNDTDWLVEIDPNDKDKQNLLFHYPRSIKKNENEYVQSVVKLEFGGRGDRDPNELKEITPYAYQILPEVFEGMTSISIPTLTALRTFWEKITLLHAEHHRSLINPPDNRTFRHYYDVTMLNKHGITTKALEDISILDKVVMNKKAYFYSAWANYDTAKIGSICLLPNPLFIDILHQDCNKMSEMFFGEAPNFNEVMEEIEAIEKIINSNL